MQAGRGSGLLFTGFMIFTCGWGGLLIGVNFTLHLFCLTFIIVQNFPHYLTLLLIMI